jgi:Secretion system C-terminal sorting domain
MKKYLLLLLLGYSALLQAQSPPFSKLWDIRFGGTYDDIITGFEQLPDSTFFLAGSSISGITGDKTEDNRDTSYNTPDFWILKAASNGPKLWDKTYGGSGSEELMDYVRTADGGYLLGGQTFSGISGDKTEPNWDPTLASNDYWIVKTDAAGNKQWDKRFGGTSFDILNSVNQTADGGYLLAGSSFSGISGDKTQANQGAWDYWLVKTNASGVKLWDRRFGGLEDDFATAACQTADGGILVGGYSKSNPGGDKTQPCQGNWDYWVVKVNAQGNKVWDKTLGGNYTDWLFDMILVSDGGFLLGGQSFSEASGDKSEPNHDATPAGSDYWIVRLDAGGNKLWDRTFGGSEIDDISRIVELSDGGFLLSGESYSPADGNKTEANLGIEQTWVVKTDSVGTFLWDKTIFTYGHDELGTAIPSGPDCFVVVNLTMADSGGYVSENMKGNGDFWMVKLCNTPNGISELQATTDWKIYPNPSSGLIHLVAAENKEAMITITDYTGRIIHRINQVNISAGEEITMDIAEFPNGIYLIRIIGSDGVETMKQLVLLK